MGGGVSHPLHIWGTFPRLPGIDAPKMIVTMVVMIFRHRQRQRVRQYHPYSELSRWLSRYRPAKRISRPHRPNCLFQPDQLPMPYINQRFAVRPSYRAKSRSAREERLTDCLPSPYPTGWDLFHPVINSASTISTVEAEKQIHQTTTDRQT